MGCDFCKPKIELSPEMAQKIMGVFNKMDGDGSKCIDKIETLKYWKSNFAKVNTDALFKAVDVDNSGTITQDEWMEFWHDVKRQGYTEEEIEEEIENLLGGYSWVSFEKKYN